MLSPMKPTLRRALIGAGACAALLLSVAPASADHRRHGHYWHGGYRPKVAVVIGLPPILVGAAHRPDGYDDDSYRRTRYERGYEHGYDDGYDDRAREEWRRRYRHRHHHRHHDDCDD